MRWFVVDNDIIINVIVYDGGGGWTPPRGCHLVEATPGVDIGWRMIDGKWISPPIPEETISMIDESII